LAQAQLDIVQLEIYHLGINQERATQELECLTSYNQALNIANNFWQDKAKNARFLDRDRNTSFFHRSIKIREAQSHISLLRYGDEVFTDSQAIEDHTLNYFKNIFPTSNMCIPNGLPASLIPNLVTDLDNSMLTALPNSDEIRKVVFDLNGDFAPGPDGFSGHVIRSDVIHSTQYFFTNNDIMPNLNSNLSILIPKMPGADKLDNFRPIALANFQFNIITKILA
jgi:hypothetical protein